MQNQTSDCDPVAWRINSWRQQVAGMSRTKFYEELDAGRIKCVKLGSATLVVTPPAAYLAQLPDAREAA
jgi:hypothetical protein